LEGSIDIIGLADLAVASVTAVAASYLAFAALKNSAKPRFRVAWLRSSQETLRTTGDDDVFIFDVINIGHWYAKPPARDISLEFTCPWVFRKAELLRGGRGGVLQASGVSRGSEDRIILRAVPFTLHVGERAKFAIEVEWYSNVVGGGSIAVKAHSMEGASFHKHFGFSFEQ
jgi:hypothetical protein